MQIALEVLDAWNRRDLDGVLRLMSEDIEWYDPAMADPPARGKPAVRAFAEAVLAAFPDFRFEIQHPISNSADGSRCAIRWQIQATHIAPLAPLGYAPTGRRAVFEGVDVVDVREGKICRIFTAFDPLPAAEQLLDMRLRPLPGTWRGRAAVTVQRFLAFLTRRRNRSRP